MKKLTTLFLFALLPLMASASTLIDGIYYNFSGIEATVTYYSVLSSSNQTAYTGSVIIPSMVRYGSSTYRVTEIGDDAFRSCSGLTSVTIPNSVTSIGKDAFSGCSGLTSVTIPNSVTCIGDYAFRYCSGLTSVTIPNSVTSIGWAAFMGCSSLTSITIPNSVTSIVNSAFAGCSGLKSITIPNSVTTIGQGAFSGCSNLTSITIPNSVTSIGSEVFYNCSSLTSVEIPNSVTSIEGYAFSGCSGLKSVTIGDGVTSIGVYAFRYCSGLTSVTIPNSVTSIGRYAFSGCSNLKSITIPNSVIEVEDHAFNGTVWYNNQPNGLVYAGKVAYEYKGTMPENTSITLEEGTLGVSSSAFYGCSGLKSIFLPNSVTSIGSSAFRNCSGLTSVTIGNSVTSIGSSAFYNCSSLTSVKINSNDIVSNSYTSSSNIGSVFGSQVTEYILGDDVIEIGNYAFYNCSSLTSVTIPNSVTTIGNSTFSGCSSLTSVTIPNSVTSIGIYAFSGCSGLKSVVVGNNINSIGQDAFGNCKELLDVYCYARKGPSTHNFAFNGADIQFAVLHVLEISINGYKTTVPWSGFGNIIALTDSDPTPEIESEPARKCDTPTITYADGKVTFSCGTEGAELHYKYSKEGVGNEAEIPQSLNVTVYATKDGYENSEVATKEINVSSASGIRGDVNLDGTVSMPDAMFIVNKILNGKFPDE